MFSAINTLVSNTIKTYRKNKNKRDFSRFVYTEGLHYAKNKQSMQRLYAHKLVKKSNSGKIDFAEKLQTFKENSMVVFSGKRRQQIADMAEGRYEVKTATEKSVDRAIAMAILNFGILSLSFFYAPLVWLVVPGIIYSSIPLFARAYRSVVEEKRASTYILDSAVVIGGLLGQYFVALVVGGWIGLASLKLFAHNESNVQKNLSNLFGEQPRSVWILVDGEVELEIPFEDLQLGDTIIVSAGQAIPVDGVIKSGFASIDQHKLTGESQPVEKGGGDSVLAATVILSGKLYIEVQKTGQETVAMQIGKILNQTADFKDSMHSRGELIADRSVLPTTGLFLLSFPLLGPNGALGVLVNKFGSKMRVFGPTSTLIYLNFACQQGILIKDGRSLEQLTEVDTVLFDKTGTLTLEQPTVGKIHTCCGVAEDDVLRYTAAAEHGQTHPIAKAILKAANERGLQWTKIEDARYEIGYGIQVNLSDRMIRVGSKKFLDLENIAIPPEMSQIQADCHREGHSLVYTVFDDQLVGAIELQATIRPEAKEVIDYLHQRNISIYIISGDHETPTKKLAQTLGVDHYFANTLPENKAALVEKLRAEGKSICFVGDGINDTIALKKANVSISLRGATTIATDTAQVVLMDGTLTQLPQLFKTAQDFNTNIKHSFLFSIVPTGISLTGIFFFHWGFFAAMVLSQTSMFLGVSNAMLPLFKEQNKE